VDAEFAPWRKLRPFSQKAIENSVCYISQIGTMEIAVLLTGIGGKSVWSATAKRIWNRDLDICISSGLAGGLKSSYQIGEVLVARAVEAVNRNKTVACDPDLLGWAVDSGAREVELFYSTDRVILTAAEKREIGQKADAVEMESGEVLDEAQVLGARAIAIRGISDSADEDLPLDFNRVTNSSGEVSLARVMGQVLQHPAAIPSLVRFGRQSNLAAGKLCEFLDTYVQRISSNAKLTSAGVTAE
jgi:nucleoside phosphorylase